MRKTIKRKTNRKITLYYEKINKNNKNANSFISLFYHAPSSIWGIHQIIK